VELWGELLSDEPRDTGLVTDSLVETGVIPDTTGLDNKPLEAGIASAKFDCALLEAELVLVVDSRGTGLNKGAWLPGATEGETLALLVAGWFNVWAVLPVKYDGVLVVELPVELVVLADVLAVVLAVVFAVVFAVELTIVLAGYMSIGKSCVIIFVRAEKFLPISVAASESSFPPDI